MADLTTQILLEIRDEIRSTNSRLDETNSRLDQTNSRLDRLERRQVDAEIRISTELVAVTGAIRDVHETLLADRGLRDTVADHEHRLRALETTRP